MSNLLIQTTQPTEACSPVRTTSHRSEKIADHHLQRLAIVYVRQSTQQQVLEHRESTARQYALTDRAIALCWPSVAVEIIDEDQGRSGSSAEGRSGFQRLLAKIRRDIQEENDAAQKLEEIRYKNTTDGAWLEKREEHYKALTESLYLHQLKSHLSLR